MVKLFDSNHIIKILQMLHIVSANVTHFILYIKYYNTYVL